MTQKTTLYAGFVKELYYHVLASGVDAKQLEAETELSPQDLENMDARIPISQNIRLWHAAINLSKNEALALELGDSSNPKNLGIVSLVILNSPNLGQMYAQVIRYTELIAQGDRIEMEKTDQHIYLSYSIDVPENFTIYAVERSIATALKWTREYAGEALRPEALRPKELRPEEIHFAYPKPRYVQEYEKIFQCPLKFEQAENRIVFDKAVLQLPACNYNPSLDELLNNQAEYLLDELDGSESVVQQTRRLIVRHLPEGNLNVEKVSSELNMSRRTLARKLKEEGTSFKDLAEKTKKALSVDYLKQNTISINDIAFLLGFSESSAFSRAFKRWYGDYPQGYRRVLLAAS